MTKAGNASAKELTSELWYIILRNGNNADFLQKLLSHAIALEKHFAGRE